MGLVDQGPDFGRAGSSKLCTGATSIGISSPSDPSPPKSSSEPVPDRVDSRCTGCPKDERNGGRESVGCAANWSTAEVVCSRTLESIPGPDLIVDAILASNWRSESMKRQRIIEAILRVPLTVKLKRIPAGRTHESKNMVTKVCTSATASESWDRAG